MRLLISDHYMYNMWLCSIHPSCNNPCTNDHITTLWETQFFAHLFVSILCSLPNNIFHFLGCPSIFIKLQCENASVITDSMGKKKLQIVKWALNKILAKLTGQHRFGTFFFRLMFGTETEMFPQHSQMKKLKVKESNQKIEIIDT